MKMNKISPYFIHTDSLNDYTAIYSGSSIFAVSSSILLTTTINCNGVIYNKWRSSSRNICTRPTFKYSTSCRTALGRGEIKSLENIYIDGGDDVREAVILIMVIFLDVGVFQRQLE